MTASTVWHGTDAESAALLEAMARNCICVVDASGVRTATCAPHHLLVSDQRALDGLVWMHRDRERLIHEEETD